VNRCYWVVGLLLGFIAYAQAATAKKYSYWVESCSQPESGCQANDPELAAWALEAWQKASGGAIEVSRSSDPRHARIRIFWATAEQGLYGEARPVLVDGQRGAEVYVRPAPFRTGDDKLLRDAIAPMMKAPHKLVAVVDGDGRLVGALDRADILRGLIQE